MTRVRDGVGGFLAYVRPTFMFPAVGMSAYGAALAPAGQFEWSVAAVHAGTVGLALFVAHLRDGYIDGHRRGEETPRLSASTFRRAIWVGSVAVVLFSGLLATVAGAVAALSTAVLLALALLHAPYLDRHPVTVTVDYPFGIGVALIGGHAAQAGAVGLTAVVAALFVGLLAGIKIGIDRLDAVFDRSIGKRTIPVAFGTEGANRIAAGVFLFTAVTALGVAVAGAVGRLAVRPSIAAAAAVVPLSCLLATIWLSPERSVRVQMGLTYAFAVLLFVSVCESRCAGVVISEQALEAVRRAISG